MYDPDGTQRQEKITAEELRDICAGCIEYKCLLFTPKSVPHSLSTDDAEPYAKSIKIPVVDLIVDFGDHVRGPRLNHIGNVRPARLGPHMRSQLRRRRLIGSINPCAQAKPAITRS